MVGYWAIVNVEYSVEEKVVWRGEDRAYPTRYCYKMTGNNLLLGGVHVDKAYTVGGETSPANRIACWNRIHVSY